MGRLSKNLLDTMAALNRQVAALDARTSWGVQFDSSVGSETGSSRSSPAFAPAPAVELEGLVASWRW